MTTLRAYEEIVDFIASGTNPKSIIAFTPSDSVKERVGDLIYFEKIRGLSDEEKSELDHYMQLEHIMRLAKARAHKYAPIDRYIDKKLRRFVAERADYFCEYCLIHESDTYLGCEIDHIISLKHGGKTDADNLAYSCSFCNRHKGSDVGSVIIGNNEFIRFYNPRIDHWTDHFELDGSIIRPLTDIGEVTCNILMFNSDERIIEREFLIDINRYLPCSFSKIMNRKK